MAISFISNLFNKKQSVPASRRHTFDSSFLTRMSREIQSLWNRIQGESRSAQPLSRVFSTRSEEWAPILGDSPSESPTQRETGEEPLYEQIPFHIYEMNSRSISPDALPLRRASSFAQEPEAATGPIYDPTRLFRYPEKPSHYEFVRRVRYPEGSIPGACERKQKDEKENNKWPPSLPPRDVSKVASPGRRRHSWSVNPHPHPDTPPPLPPRPSSRK